MGADVPGAHALLATIEPASVGPALLEPVLDALLKGAGGTRGLALDASSRCHPAVRGIAPEPGDLASSHAGPRPRGSAHVASYDQRPPRANVRREPAAGERSALDPRIVPLTAGDDTLAWIALERSPGGSRSVSPRSRRTPPRSWPG